MFRKTVIAALAAVAVLGLAVPAAAETYTSADGILSLELPDEGWKEIEDPNKWIVLTDGANMITVDHYANGETLPEMTVADDHYVNVYQAVVSTQNEVFILTGSLVDAAKMQDLCNIIISAKVLKYDTKVAVKKEIKTDTNTSEYTIASMDATMYATAGVNVRAGFSTSDTILGAVAEGEAVKVTGSVQKGGKDYGWYQISYNGGTGYVSAEFISKTAGASASKTSSGSSSSKTSSPQFTARAKTIYDQNGNAVTVYEATDGYWYDNTGKQYNWIEDYKFSTIDGTVYTVNKPQSGSTYATGSPIPVYWANGNGDTVTPYSDGYYYSDEWVRYTYGGDGCYYGADGTVLYDSYTSPSGDRGSSPDDDDAYPTGTSLVAFWGDGSPQDLYEYTDGSWRTGEGLSFADGGDGNYYRTDGMTLYGDNPTGSISDDSEDTGTEQHYLVQQQTGTEVLVTAGGGAYYDAANNEYSWVDDGTMMDYYGNLYDVRW